MASRPLRRTGDDRTLQLAAPALSSDVVAAFLRYQERVLERLQADPGLATDPGALAEAHDAALEKSSLSPRGLEEVRSAVRRFAANRLAARKFRSRLKTLEEAAGGAEAPELARTLREELARLDADLGHRDRPETVQALSGLEEQLLSLHERLGGLG